MTFHAPQLMELTEGCNLRDLGGHETADGLEVRRGILYRSGVLSYLTPSDHNCLARVRPRTIVDLRTAQEIAAEPTQWLLPVQMLSRTDSGPADHLPARAGEVRQWIEDRYATMHLWLKEPVHAILQAVLDEEMPVLFHGSLGKDRTGFCAAILLLLLGVEEDIVLREYAFTNDTADLDDFVQSHASAARTLMDENMVLESLPPAARDAVLAADPAYLRAALRGVEAHHGSVERYVWSMGFTQEQIEVIRFQLLD